MKFKDYYYNQAKKNNYPARSIFKLKEIDEKYHFIQNGFKILELGASPGSWSLYILSKFRIFKGILFLIDKNKIDLDRYFSKYVSILNKNLFVLQKDVFDIEASDFLPVQTFDLIISDMAPETTSQKFLTHQISIDLLTETLKHVDSFLKKNGHFIFKIFQGENLNKILLYEVKPRFEKYVLFKPKSSKNESSELYIIAFSKKKK